LIKKADESEYIKLYRDMQPGQNVYWNGFGEPPTLSFRADFNDIEFNRERQLKRELIKGRFSGGNLGWIVPEDMELFIGLYSKPLTKPTTEQLAILHLIESSGPYNIQQIKEETGLLVKQITPILHRLQEAFLIYEDQYDGEWDRGGDMMEGEVWVVKGGRIELKDGKLTVNGCACPAGKAERVRVIGDEHAIEVYVGEGDRFICAPSQPQSRHIPRQTNIVRSGYDGKKCLVHARCCQKEGMMLATAQYLNVDGGDLFSGLYMSQSFDGGRNWTEFVPQENMRAVEIGEDIYGLCDATPMYHHKTGKILVLGDTIHYKVGGMGPADRSRSAFYGVFDEEKNAFKEPKIIEMPEGYYPIWGCGSGQSLEMENGDLLIPVSCETGDSDVIARCMALRCGFDGETIRFVEMGNELSVPFGRGLCEPSVIEHQGTYYMTFRNAECGFVARSEDGLHYTDLQLWKWSDGSILQNYCTQQHWMKLGDELYLVYTRRDASNGHVFRNRAPLYMAKVDGMRLVPESEQICVSNRGARLGNFGVSQLNDTKAVIMAAEWMQYKGCEKYGSDNSIFVVLCGE